MIRLHVTAEGQTEQRFVQRVIVPHLAKYDVFVDVRCVLTSRNNRRSKTYRGGLVSYDSAKQDILDWLKQDRNQECRFTTMFDLYGLPQDFPGHEEATRLRDGYQKVSILERRLAEDIGDERFVPYIQLHEFEALVLADPRQLACVYCEHDEAIAKLIAEVGSQSPELINDGRDTAPSKRILGAIPEYDKATSGPMVAEMTGLPTLREKCGHFGEWLSTLEQLDKASGARHQAQGVKRKTTGHSNA